MSETSEIEIKLEGLLVFREEVLVLFTDSGGAIAVVDDAECVDTICEKLNKHFFIPCNGSRVTCCEAVLDFCGPVAKLSWTSAEMRMVGCEG